VEAIQTSNTSSGLDPNERRNRHIYASTGRIWSVKIFLKIKPVDVM